MTRLAKLSVKNFRGIQNLELNFGDERIICFIGRGDSGKTTVLEAISNVLSPSWNLTFYDTDFHNCDLVNTIEIEASLIDFPDNLMSDEKYGLHIRSLDTRTNEISDEVPQEDADETIKPVLTIKLTVDKTLEPKWTVTNTREQEEKSISTSDRASINCSLVSDYLDRHFSWNKGNPLYQLLKGRNAQDIADENTIVLDSLRQAKGMIDEYKFEELEEATNFVKQRAAVFGLNISNADTTMDFKELSVKGGRISLHENSVPFRLKGKGSKRLASFAIQSALVSDGGIMLSDEIEQGLEPDRVKQLIRTLKQQQSGQIFLTTHSREAVTELEANNLLLLVKESNGSKIDARQLIQDNDSLQKSVRACPEAFFAKKVVVCEGATEVGICRALDKWRISQNKEQMSFKDCAYVDGTGDTLVERSIKIHQAGITTALFCDSDKTSVNEQKNNLKESGIQIFDCEAENCIEKQIFANLPWDGVKELINYALVNHYNNDRDALISSVKSKYQPSTDFPQDGLDNDTPELRNAIAIAATKKKGEWFKTIHHGEALGNIIFNYINEMDTDCHLRKTLTDLSSWVDG